MRAILKITVYGGGPSSIVDIKLTPSPNLRNNTQTIVKFNTQTITKVGIRGVECAKKSRMNSNPNPNRVAKQCFMRYCTRSVHALSLR